MYRSFILMMFLFPTASIAGENVYQCSIAQVLELSESGLMGTHEGIFRQLVGSQFLIDRKSGEMKGLPFATSGYKDVRVLDHGSSENSFKAIVTSHPPNMWVKYVYVAEYKPGTKKPFWGTDDGDKIFSGQCE